MPGKIWGRLKEDEKGGRGGGRGEMLRMHNIYPCSSKSTKFLVTISPY